MNKNAVMASNLVIAENINAGRKFVFDKYFDDIYAYQWSALLDGGTCNYCRSMDGKTISAADKSFSSYQPGRVHFGCRCIWVAVLKDDASLPAYTGIPKSLKPQSEVPPWEFQDISAPLPGSSSLEIDERLYESAGVGNPINYGDATYNENGRKKK
jgi:SPP1 gp7 family putative phage head morphogenesis protein